MKSLFTKSIQKVAVHRFCAFADMGGDLSYAVALLDNQNNGVYKFIMENMDLFGE